MEEGKIPKSGNHDIRKSTRIVCEESKTARAVTNQNYKTNRNDKSVKEVGKSSTNGNSFKKIKQNDVCPEKSGENKSRKTNNCNPGYKDMGSGLQDQNHSKGKRLPNVSTAVENPKALKVQPAHENLPTSHILENGASTEILPTAQRGTPELENPLKENTSKINVNWCNDSEKSKIKNSDSAKESKPETDYLENVAVMDESTLMEEEQLGLKQAEERLERDYIIRLEKRTPEYSNCQYLCKLCLVHIENIQGAHKHIKEKRHKKNIMEKQEENELRALPSPSPAQVAALNFMLMEAAKEKGISDDDFKCSLRMYGSCLTRFAFKTSDVNIDIKFPSTMSHPDVLIQVLDILKNTGSYSDVESDFHAKVPVVFCKDVKSGLTCKVSAGNDVACLTTDLLAALGKLEPVLVPLVLAFRYWARLCHIDCQAEGGIPSYSFALMIIFFLQQREPRILPSYLGNWIEGFDSKKADDYQLKGIKEKKLVVWEYKLSNNGGKNVNTVEGKSKGEQHRNGNKSTAALESDVQNNPKEKKGHSPLSLETSHQISLGQLWLELLKFYTLEFALEEYVISIRVQELLTRENKNWPKRRIAIEDPFALKRNVARSLNSQMVFEYILERFRTAYKYFACPQSKDETKPKTDTKKKEKGKIGTKRTGEPVINCCLPQQTSITGKHKPGHGCNLQECKFNECNGMESMTRRCTEKLKSFLVNSEIINTDSGDREETVSFISNECCELEHKSLKRKDDQELSAEEELSHCCVFNEHKSLDTDSVSGLSDTERLDSVMEYPTDSMCSGTSISATSHNCKTVEETQDIRDEVTTEEMHYVFDKFILTSGKPPTIVCSICKRDGHSKSDCPEDFKKIDLNPLPPMTNRFREILDLVCKRCFDELSPPFSEQQNREQILASLERFIRKEYNEKARLCLFGSSKNGFGFRDSDLDICMTLEGYENAEKLNCKEIIESLAKVLKKHPGLRNILPITTAKVPIAQHNTRMLATYAAIDPRVQYLGYTMKVFAKRCDIGDASRGSLSSYAYILMVLYFLQQREPPVIPVLQEIFDGQQIPQRMVDGWNAFFFDDTDELKKRLPSLGKNTESLGELWLGLLRFYTEEFDFKEYVISIRQKKLLTTFEKQWTSKCIAIEDPFDLNHNLGAGVSRKMTNFIMKALINGRKLFGTPYYPISGREAVSSPFSALLTNEQEYFFNSKVLTDGELAPNDRCCRVCGKIASQLVRSLVNSQQVTGSIQQQVERPLRTRQPSECSDSHQPSYSPQPQQFTQNSSPPASINQTQPQSISQSKHTLPPQQGAQSPHQVQLPLFNFAQSPPGQYSTLPNLGVFQMPHHHQIPFPNTSWPVIHSAPGNPPHATNVPFSVRAGSSNPPNNQSTISLNDPSIIFAQPAARPVGIPSTSHEGPWHNPVTLSSLVNNGTVGNSDQGFQGQFGKGNPPPPIPWDHGATTHFPLLRGTWPYSISPNYMQQGNASYPLNKPFYPQAGLLMQNQRFSLLSQGHPHLNMNFIQQKK
ncbi:Terminal uridylyltransferase 4, partial [Ophiophagus hannah]